MKVTRLMITIVILGSLVLMGCGGAKPTPPREVYQPTWYGATGNAEYLFVYGNAERTSQQAAESSAYASALAEAANSVETSVATMMKDFISEAGIDNPEVLSLTERVTRTVANQRFSGTQITQRQTVTVEGGRYKAFVQVALPKSEINRDLKNRIKNEEALYTRFRASQAFQELDRATGDSE